MSSRSDLLNGLSESFTYDNLDRLTAAQVGAATAKDYGYSIVGNLIEKSDVGDYSYNLVQPHAVGQISQGGNTNDYAYDTNGNLNSGDDLPSLTWASYNKPTQIQKNGITYNFKYGPDRLRYQKTHSSGGTTTTTHYLGNFEQSNDGTTTQYRHHIRAGERVIAVLTDDGNSIELKYLHRDHLGSVTAITNTSGGIIERLSYGPWGQRRDATDWETIITTATDHRGYTGHEHLDDIGLIHMNGRVYSPKLGRMLSPDPLVKSAENGQDYNRYSYAMNNPLRYTDPSGYLANDDDDVISLCIFCLFKPTYSTPNGRIVLENSCTASGARNLVFNRKKGLWEGPLSWGANKAVHGCRIISGGCGENAIWRQPGFNATPDASGTQGVVGSQENAEKVLEDFKKILRSNAYGSTSDYNAFKYGGRTTIKYNPKYDGTARITTRGDDVNGIIEVGPGFFETNPLESTKVLSDNQRKYLETLTDEQQRLTILRHEVRHAEPHNKALSGLDERNYAKTGKETFNAERDANTEAIKWAQHQF